MIIEGRVRARVLKVEGDVVNLGVYVQQTWVRIKARTIVSLPEGVWIEGDLKIPSDGSMVIFHLDETTLPRQTVAAPAQSLSGIDLEA